MSDRIVLATCCSRDATATTTGSSDRPSRSRSTSSCARPPAAGIATTWPDHRLRTVYDLVRQIVESRSFKLIEALAEAIAHELLAELRGRRGRRPGPQAGRPAGRPARPRQRRDPALRAAT